jgi:hypothetical protein
MVDVGNPPTARHRGDREHKVDLQADTLGKSMLTYPYTGAY